MVPFAVVQKSLHGCLLTASLPVALMYVHLGTPTSTLHCKLTAAHFKVLVFFLSGLFFTHNPSLQHCFVFQPDSSCSFLHIFLNCDGPLAFLQIMFLHNIGNMLLPPLLLVIFGKVKRVETAWSISLLSSFAHALLLFGQFDLSFQEILSDLFVRSVCPPARTQLHPPGRCATECNVCR